MLVTASIWALVPLAVDLTGGDHAPFMFNAGWRLGGFVGCVSFLLVRYNRPIIEMLANRHSPTRQELKKSFGFSPSAISLADRDFGGWALVYGTLGKLDYVAFAFAASFASVSIVAVLYEIGPIILVLCMAVLFAASDQYRKTGSWLFVMVFLCFVGFTLIVWPERTIIGGNAFYLGIGLAVLSAVMYGSHIAALLNAGDHLGRRLQDRGESEESSDSLYVFSAVLVQAICLGTCMALSVVVGLLLGERFDTRMLIYSGIGGLMASAADVLFRKANALSDNIGINAITYTAPIFAIAWLAAFSTVQVARMDFFAIGVIIIVVSNVLINFEAEIRFGFRSLILSLGLFGLVVYLRDEILRLLNVADWNWGTPEYFASVGMSGTVFTLLLAFRTGRIVSRTDAEENRIFAVFRKLELLVERGVIDRGVLNCILRVDKPQNYADLQAAYHEARRYMTGVAPLNDADRQMLSEAEADLDALVRSRQSAIVLGELFALIIFAAITVFLAIFAHPMSNVGWARFLIDLFAMMVSPVIIFLLVNVWDLHRERDAGWLELDPETDDYVVRFPDSESRLADQWLSVGIGVAIVGTFAALIANKWLGWFG